MCIVINLDVVCLICLQYDKQMHSIFTPDPENPDELQIAQKISVLSELKLDENDESMPDKICNKCLQDMKAAWRFHKNCQAAKTIFQAIIPSSKTPTPPPAVDAIEECEDLTAKKLAEQKIKVPQGLQIKRIESNDDLEEVKPGVSKSFMKSSQAEESAISKVSAYDLTSIKDDPATLMNQLAPSDVAEEDELFQSLNELGEEKEEEFCDDDDLVELYLNDDTLQEEQQMQEINKAVEAALSKQNEKLRAQEKSQTKILKIFKNDSKYMQVNSLKSIVDSPKESTERSRSRTRHRQVEQQPLAPPPQRQQQKEIPQTLSQQQLMQSRPKIVKQHIIQNNPKIAQQQQQQKQQQQQIAASTNSALQSRQKEDTSFTELRDVRTRKRKSLSPDTKPPKICDICGNSYRYQHALNAHMRRHFNDKPFPCEVCEKAFVSNVELRRHMRVHTGAKPYACQYCERRFSDFGSRIKHERTHTGERPYKCTTCSKSFAYPHVLSVHLRTHTGEKRFRCDKCSKGFTKKAYLQTHMEQHHNSINNFQIVLDDTSENSQMVPMKSVAFEECIFTTEYITGEGDNDIPVVQERDDEEEEYEEEGEYRGAHDVEEEEEYEDEDDQGDHHIIIQQTLLQPKQEDCGMDEEGDDDVHEVVEIHPDEYTIRVR